MRVGRGSGAAAEVRHKARRVDALMKEDVSAEELARCLRAIARHPKGASEVGLSPAEIYGHRFAGGRTVYINFLKPSELPVGSVYRTWVVRFAEGRLDGVSYFRSRRGEAADDTLPPDD